MGKYQRHDHNGPAIMRVGNVTIGGASDAGKDVVPQTNLIIDCTGTEFKRIPARKSISPRLAKLLSGTALLKNIKEYPERIVLDWPNGAAPPVTEKFFYSLVENARKSGGGHIVFTCIGGHGRTGTCLAAIRMIYFNETAKQAINWVRKNHCTHAIETKAQIRWIWNVSKRLER